MKRTLSGILNAAMTRMRLLRLKFSGRSVRCFGIQYFAGSSELKIDKGAKVEFGSGVYLRKNCSLKIRKGATLKFGDGVMLNNGCLIGCHDSVELGDGTVLGPGVLIYDHDHDYRKDLHGNEYVTQPVVVGKDCWIGANAILLRGTVIGDNCVVGAGCILKGEYPANQLILQKRDTECRAIIQF